MGEKGAWVLQRWLRDQIAARYAARRDGPPDRRRAGLDLAEPSVELLPDQPRPDDRRRERRARSSWASASSAPAAITTRSTSGPRTTTTAWPPSSPTSRASRPNNVRKDKLDTHEINGDEIIYLPGRPRIVQPRTGVVLEPKYPDGPAIAVGRSRRRKRPRRAWRAGSRATIPSSTATWPTASGSTCSAGASSSPSMTSATRTRRRTPRCSMH